MQQDLASNATDQAAIAAEGSFIPAQYRNWLVLNPADQLVEVGDLLRQRVRLFEYAERQGSLPQSSLITMLV